VFNEFRSKVAVLPLGAGIAGVVVVLGTIVGQAGHAAGAADPNPMAGMNMSGGSMSGTSMPQMAMPGDSKTAPTTTAAKTGDAAPAAGMAGMDMSDPKMAGMDMTKPGAAPMDMSDPKMAAAMPGGLHTTCKADACTVVFADTATGIAKVLGTTAHLEHAAGKTMTLTVGGHKLTLTRGKALTAGKVKVELMDVKGHAFTVRFSKAN